jgi:hypothetical protein
MRLNHASLLKHVKLFLKMPLRVMQHSLTNSILLWTSVLLQIFNVLFRKKKIFRIFLEHNAQKWSRKVNKLILTPGLLQHLK